MGHARGVPLFPCGGSCFEASYTRGKTLFVNPTHSRPIVRRHRVNSKRHIFSLIGHKHVTAAAQLSTPAADGCKRLLARFSSGNRHVEFLNNAGGSKPPDDPAKHGADADREHNRDDEKDRPHRLKLSLELCWRICGLWELGHERLL
jgi:hypothetical protein